MPLVGLNAHLLSHDRSYRAAGVSRYIEELLIHLPQVESELSLLAFLGGKRASFPGWEHQKSKWPTERPFSRIAWEQVVQPWETYRQKLDLLHVPMNVGPIIASCPIVVTVHDLSFYHYPELFRPLQRVYQQVFTRRTVSRAAGVIAVSHSTRDDLIRMLGVPEDKVTVIHNGVGDEMYPIENLEKVNAFRHQRQLPKEMILFLGTIEPRKNLVSLLEAYAILRKKRDFNHQLVIAGARGWYYEKIYDTVERLGLRNEVLFPGYVPSDELALWYNAASLFVYPSLYEGFGLPPLEAMACGTPVIVSNVSSLPEVVGEAGLTVDPRDPSALANAISHVLRDAQLRRKLREAGLVRTKEYSWRATALQTAQLYHRMLDNE
ncbi:MAG: hypothetical protein A2Y73_07290 [Chloroflexi bacterium RBG_13_56_8]|nr:MAG: hypothetical protein A2Y73_07290 [Chloroflexi bacterium RBG_13_56_8]